MKKLIIAAFILSFFLTSFDLAIAAPSCSSNSPCCCTVTEGSPQKRCFTTGVCCAGGTTEEHWEQFGCFRFTLTASAPASFVVGTKTGITVSTKNIGSYPDNYNLQYELISDNPNLISLETTGATSIGTLNPDQSGSVFPRVTVFSTTSNGIIRVTATSSGDSAQVKTANVSVSGESYPLSLPEFSNFLIVGLILSASLAYILIPKRRKR